MSERICRKTLTQSSESRCISFALDQHSHQWRTCRRFRTTVRTAEYWGRNPRTDCGKRSEKSPERKLYIPAGRPCLHSERRQRKFSQCRSVIPLNGHETCKTCCVCLLSVSAISCSQRRESPVRDGTQDAPS